MKKIFLLMAFTGIATTAQAGFQFGVVCKDSDNAKYLFSDNIQKEDAFANQTECLSGKCKKSILSIKGVTTDSGIIFSGKDFSDIKINDEIFSNESGVSQDGDALILKEVNGTALICGPRKLLSDLVK